MCSAFVQRTIVKERNLISCSAESPSPVPCPTCTLMMLSSCANMERWQSPKSSPHILMFLSDEPVTSRVLSCKRWEGGGEEGERRGGEGRGGGRGGRGEEGRGGEGRGRGGRGEEGRGGEGRGEGRGRGSREGLKRME